MLLLIINNKWHEHHNNEQLSRESFCLVFFTKPTETMASGLYPDLIDRKALILLDLYCKNASACDFLSSYPDVCSEQTDTTFHSINTTWLPKKHVVAVFTIFSSSVKVFYLQDSV